MAFIHNINPTLLQLGPFEIRYYGLVYVIGFLLVYYALWRKRDELGLSKEDVDNYVLYSMIGVIVGARLIHVFFWGLTYYLANPIRILMIWQGGLAFHGGLLGLAVVSYYFCKKKNVSLARIADIIVIPAIFALALGRIANFINGELWGPITNVSWCVKFPGADGCRHPYQLYAALKRFVVFGILLAFNRRKHKDGFLFWSFMGLTGIGRFLLDFFREDARLLGLSAGQYLSLVIVILTVWVMLKYYKKEIGWSKNE